MKAKTGSNFGAGVDKLPKTRSYRQRVDYTYLVAGCFPLIAARQLSQMSPSEVSKIAGIIARYLLLLPFAPSTVIRRKSVSSIPGPERRWMADER